MINKDENPIDRVVLWDLDGTLVSHNNSTRNSIHFEAVIKSGFTPKRQIPKLQGSTDFEIISSLYTSYSKPDKNFQVEKTFYYLDQLSIESYGWESFSANIGVVKILSMCRDLGWKNGILTGNTHTRMIQKLHSARLIDLVHKDFFFSCKVNDSRETLTQRAIKRLEQRGITDFFVVGDTPRDVNVAKSFGLQIVSIATGEFSVDQLRNLKPNLILTDFEKNSDDFKNFLQTKIGGKI